MYVCVCVLFYVVMKTIKNTTTFYLIYICVYFTHVSGGLFEDIHSTDVRAGALLTSGETSLQVNDSTDHSWDSNSGLGRYNIDNFLWQL